MQGVISGVMGGYVISATRKRQADFGQDKFARNYFISIVLFIQQGNVSKLSIM